LARPTRAFRWARRWRWSWRGAGRNVPFAYNRKEAKDHGEGGTLVGAPLQGRVLIVDDVMSAGTAVRESIAIIEAAGATPHAVCIALDRQEMATEDGQRRALQRGAVCAAQQLGLQVCAIAKLARFDAVSARLATRPLPRTTAGCRHTATATAQNKGNR